MTKENCCTIPKDLPNEVWQVATIFSQAPVTLSWITGSSVAVGNSCLAFCLVCGSMNNCLSSGAVQGEGHGFIPANGLWYSMI